MFGEWWKRDAEMVAVRDYFQVEDEDGERYWIRELHGRNASRPWVLNVFGTIIVTSSRRHLADRPPSAGDDDALDAWDIYDRAIGSLPQPWPS